MRILTKTHTLRQAALQGVLHHSMSFSCEELFLFTQLLPIGCVLRQIQRLNGREIKVALLYQLYIVGGLPPSGAPDKRLKLLALFIVFISSECQPELCAASTFLMMTDTDLR